MNHNNTLLRRRLVFILFLALVSIYPVTAEAPYKGVKILIGVKPESSRTESKLDTLMYSVLQLDFEKRGFTVKKVYSDDFNSFEPYSSENPDAKLAAVCKYTRNDSSLDISVDLYDITNKNLLSTAATSADLALDFDSELSLMVAKLLKNAESKLTVLAEEAAKKTKTDTEDAEMVKAVESKKGVKSGMEVFLDTGLSLGAGDNKNTLGNGGFNTGVSVNYWFFLPFGFIGPGASISANIYPAVGPEKSASLYTIPIGLSAAYSSSTRRLISALVQLEAGSSLATLIFSKESPLTKILPYLSIKTALRINLWNGMSLGLRTVYSICFEDKAQLSTFTPSLLVSFRSWK